MKTRFFYEIITPIHVEVDFDEIYNAIETYLKKEDCRYDIEAINDEFGDNFEYWIQTLYASDFDIDYNEGNADVLISKWEDYLESRA